MSGRLHTVIALPPRWCTRSLVRRAVLASAILLLVQLGTPAVAQTVAAPRDSALEAQTRAVAAQLRCVVCQGLSIQDSPSSLAQEMRALVRDQLAAGKTPEEVKAYFVEKYGEFVLLEPEPTGFNLLVYILPLAVLFGGAVFVFLKAKQWTQRSAERDEVHV